MEILHKQLLEMKEKLAKVESAETVAKREIERVKQQLAVTVTCWESIWE